MKHIITLLVLFVFANVMADNVHFSVQVLDEVSNEPISNCKVLGSFRIKKPKKSLDSCYESVKTTFLTDNEGKCDIHGYSNIGYAGCWVAEAPSGYYRSGIGWGPKFLFKNLLGNWVPDKDSGILYLQRVEHPIPLFVKHVDRHNNKKGIAPYDGKNSVMKFDLVKGDWLPPIGQGEVADIEFRMTCEITGKEFRWNYESVFFELNTDIVFPNEGDGIKEVRLENPKYLKIREASQVEYVNNMRFNYAIRKVVSRPQFPDEWGARTFSDHDDNRSYVFRIRSKYNEAGELIDAYYGKIYNDFVISGFPKVGPCGINFLYYLNLNSLDRNLEWDMKTNLCKDPGSIQEAP